MLKDRVKSVSAKRERRRTYTDKTYATEKGKKRRQKNVKKERKRLDMSGEENLLEKKIDKNLEG